MYPELKGRKAIVTGATAGIGKSIALQLAREEVDVAAISRNNERGLLAEKELRKLGTKSFFASCNVANPDDAQAAYDASSAEQTSMLTLVQSIAIADAARAEARRRALQPLGIAVLDSGGHLLVFQREDGAGFARL
jgi:NAD(P)-dependent dehydrogenase (short-subunit alcohol dehydrogenase family)